MHRAAVSFVLLMYTRLVCADVPHISQKGFAQNIGQYAGDILFAFDQRIIHQDRVQLFSGLSVQFLNANPSTVVAGVSPRSFTLNQYFGPDQKRWRENVPHFATVRYPGIFPGIDVECNVSYEFSGGIPAFRAIVSPGANPRQLAMSLLSDKRIGITVLSTGVAVYTLAGVFPNYYYSLGSLTAYQKTGPSKTVIPVKFVQVNESSFKVEVGEYDIGLPLMVEFGDPVSSLQIPHKFYLKNDNSVVFSGASYCETSYCSSLSKSLPDGTPVFLSQFDYVQSRWLVPDDRGNVTLAGTFGIIDLNDSSAVQDGWIGRFDAQGRLVSATHTGGSMNALAVDPNGSVYFSTSEAVFKWVPGSGQFAFTSPVKNVVSLAANSRGQIAFAATGAAGQLTTAGATHNRFDGPWMAYAGTLNQTSGAIQMATYVAIIGSNPEAFKAGAFEVHMTLALAPGGNLWLASKFDFYTPAYGAAQTLVGVSGDGSHILKSESIPYFPQIAFDAEGNLLLAAMTDFLNLPTTLDAPIRAPCISNGIYFAKKAQDGSLLYATYVNDSADFTGYGAMLTLDASGRLLVGYVVFLNEYAERYGQLDIGNPARSRIACMISPATRQPLTVFAPGELVTISGNHLGPIQQVNAAVDKDGQVPTRLAGIQVLVNLVAIPLVSVQQGVITFYIPEGTSAGSFPLEVRLNGAPVASSSIRIDNMPRFAILTADGSGWGPAAAMNQDGTLNIDKGAPPGSLVTVFGIGTTPTSGVYLGGSAISIAYPEPMPGLSPGIKQISLRVPKSGFESKLLTNGFVQFYLSPGITSEYGFRRPDVFIKVSQ